MIRNKQFIFLFFLSFLFCRVLTIQAQNFQKLYNDLNYSRGLYCLESPDSGYFLLTANESTNGAIKNFRIIKTNQYGDSIAEYHFTVPGCGYSNICYNGKKTEFVITSLSACNTGNFDSLLVNRYDLNGTLISSWSYFNDSLGIGGIIRSTSDNGFIIGGGFEGLTDYYTRFLKIDSLGNIQWKNKMLSSTDIYGVHDIVEVDHKNYVAEISEYSSGNSSIAAYSLLKLDSIGNIIWLSNPRYGEAAYNNQLAVCDSGFYFLLSDEDSQTQAMYSVLNYFDTSGVFHWQKSFFNYLTFYSFLNIDYTTGQINLVGGIKSYIGGYRLDLLVTKLNSNHDSVMSNIVAWPQFNEWTNYVTNLKSGGLAIVGSSYKVPVAAFKTFFSVCDSLGNVQASTQELKQASWNDIEVINNPSENTFKLKLNHSPQASIFIADVNGKEIVNYAGIPNSGFFGKELHAGTYFATIKTPLAHKTIKLMKLN